MPSPASPLELPRNWQDCMTQANDHSSELDDNMLPEYDLSKLGRGVRGKHAEAMRQGYAVTVHHNDGTATTRYMPPQDSRHLQALQALEDESE